MSELPSNWATTSVGELADSIQYGHTAKSSKTDVGPRFLRITDIQDNNVNWSTVPFCKIPEEQIAKYRLEKGDLLFARTGATVGKSFLIHSEVPESVFASYLIRVRVTEAVEPRYIYYFFQSADYWRQISESASGIGQPNVNGKKLAALELPIAPLPEQRRIVARIEELFSRLDAGVAALRHAKAQLQRYRQSVLAAAVTGQLTQVWREQHPDTEPANLLLERVLEERREQWNKKGKYKEPKTTTEKNAKASPPSWARATVDELGEVLLGKMLDKKKHTEGNPLAYLRNINIRWGFVDTSDLLTMHFKDTELDRYGLKEGDLLVCEGGEPGRAAVWDGHLPDLKYQKALHRVRLRSGIDPRFLALCLELDAKTGRLNRRFTGSTIKHFTRQAFIEYEIPLPPLAEQHQIVAEVEARTTAIDHLEAELDRQISRSNRLRQSTLASAFSAQL